jgi:hypothetical protein
MCSRIFFIFIRYSSKHPEMIRFLFLFLLIPAFNFAQQIPASLNDAWLRTDFIIDSVSQNTSGQVYKSVFCERSVVHTLHDSLASTPRQWREMYRFLDDSCFISVFGNDYSATWLSSNFSPENQYCIKLLTDSQLILTTSEGGTPIEIRYRKIFTTYGLCDPEIPYNISLKPAPVKRQPFVLQNTSDTNKFYTLNPWQSAEITFKFNTEEGYTHIDFTGTIFRATDSTVYISFSSKNYYNESSEVSWHFETSKDTLEEFPIKNLVRIKTNTLRREMWKSAGGTFMVLGSVATLVAAPLVGIKFKSDFEIDDKRYYSVAVPGLATFFSGMIIAILAHDRNYNLQRETYETGSKLWKPAK